MRVEGMERQAALIVSKEFLRVAVKQLDSIGEHDAAFKVLEAMAIIDKLAGPGERVRPLGRDEITTGACGEVNRRMTDQ